MTTAISTKDPRLPNRAIFIGREGEGIPVRSTGNPGISSPEEEYARQVGQLVQSLRVNPSPRGIMIVIHGGTVGLKSSRVAAEALGDSICNAGYSPIFINWNTSALDSYGEHLTRVRQGQRVSRGEGLLTAPFVLFGDVGRGVTRAPLSAYEQMRDWGTSIVSDFGDAEYARLRESFDDPNQIKVSKGTYYISDFNRLFYRYYRWPFRITHLLTVPLISEPFGTPGWDIMNRRAKNMFRRPDEFLVENQIGDRFRPGWGGTAILLDSLVALAREDSIAGRKRNITVIGHSMGAIVSNHMVRMYPQLHVNTIVYMAAASSIRDVMESVAPYMERNSDTKFYNLTLHPSADASEQTFRPFPLVPAGSFPEWIDDYYSKPHTSLDRTMGKWNNVMEAAHVFPASIRGRITLKTFGVNDPDEPGYGSSGSTPTMHGHFNEPTMGFWREEFWTAVPPRGTIVRDTFVDESGRCGRT